MECVKKERVFQNFLEIRKAVFLDEQLNFLILSSLWIAETLHVMYKRKFSEKAAAGFVSWQWDLLG